jgi:hypothetical protein
MLVKCKNNGYLRFVTRRTSSKCFEDDGRVSGKKPSLYCHFEHYEPYFEKDRDSYLLLQK